MNGRLSELGPILDVVDVRKWYPVNDGLLAALTSRRRRFVKAVDGVSFSLRRGEILGLAGESGSGKSTIGSLLLGLTACSAGSVFFEGTDVSRLRNRRETLALRRGAQMVFQNPFEALNPRLTVRDSVSEPLRVHRVRLQDREPMLVRAMQRAGLHPPEQYLGSYPHQLSGGQLQRVAIARAIVLEPRLLVADEPVSMLDVSVRAGILNLMKQFATQADMAILYISHDLASMRYACSAIAVMYLGRLVEIGPAAEVLDAPAHPYSAALVAASPRHRTAGAASAPIPPGTAHAGSLPVGCRFQDRCPRKFDRCEREEPVLEQLTEGRRVACHLYQ